MKSFVTLPSRRVGMYQGITNNLSQTVMPIIPRRLKNFLYLLGLGGDPA
jgi:hypothetical protein